MLGFLIAFWATPTMSASHLLFAGVCTAYILVAIVFEERDLLAMLGNDYRAWRERTPKFIPRLGSGRRPAAEPTPDVAPDRGLTA